MVAANSSKSGYFYQISYTVHASLFYSKNLVLYTTAKTVRDDEEKKVFIKLSCYTKTLGNK